MKAISLKIANLLYLCTPRMGFSFLLVNRHGPRIIRLVPARRFGHKLLFRRGDFPAGKGGPLEMAKTPSDSRRESGPFPCFGPRPGIPLAIGFTAMAKLTGTLRPGDAKESGFEELEQAHPRQAVNKLDLSRVGDLDADTLRREIRLVVEHLYDTEDTLLNRNERDRLVNEVLDETLGLGPLEMLLKNPTISDMTCGKVHPTSSSCTHNRKNS